MIVLIRLTILAHLLALRDLQHKVLFVLLRVSRESLLVRLVHDLSDLLLLALFCLHRFLLLGFRDLLLRLLQFSSEVRVGASAVVKVGGVGEAGCREGADCCKDDGRGRGSG